MLSSPRLEIGAKVQYDGTLFTVVGFDGAAVLIRSDKGQSSRLSVSALFGAADFNVMGAGTDRPEPAFPDLLSPELYEEATMLLAHLREAALALNACVPDGQKIECEALLANAARELGHPSLTKKVRRALNQALKAEHNKGRLRTDWKLVWKSRKK